MAKDFDYFTDLFKSFRDLLKNPVLLLPFAFILVLAMIISIISGVFIPALLLGLASTGTVASIIISVLIIILVNWYFYVSGIYGAKLLVSGKKLLPGSIFSGGLKIYPRYVAMLILQGLIFLIPLTPVIIAFYYGITPMLTSINGAPNAGLIILGVVLLLVYFLYALFIYISFFFSEVFVSLKHSGPWKALRNSFRFLKNYPGHVLLTFLVVFLLGLAVGAVSIVISLVFLPFQLLIPGLTNIFDLISAFLTGLISVVIQPVILIYMFKSFKAKKPELLKD